MEAMHTELSYFNEVTMWITSLYLILETMYLLHVKSPQSTSIQFNDLELDSLLPG